MGERVVGQRPGFGPSIDSKYCKLIESTINDILSSLPTIPTKP